MRSASSAPLSPILGWSSSTARASPARAPWSAWWLRVRHRMAQPRPRGHQASRRGGPDRLRNRCRGDGHRRDPARPGAATRNQGRGRQRLPAGPLPADRLRPSAGAADTAGCTTRADGDDRAVAILPGRDRQNTRPVRRRGLRPWSTDAPLLDGQPQGLRRADRAGWLPGGGRPYRSTPPGTLLRLVRRGPHQP
jgi:hypothetical protein